MTEISEHTAADQPSRAAQNVVVGFGLVRMNLALYAAIEDGKSIERKMFTPDGHPVGNQPYDKITRATVANDVVVKRVQVGAEEWVDLTDDEMDAVLGKDTREKGYTEVERFVPLTAVGTMYRVVGEMQARPANIKIGSSKKESTGDAKSFALLCRVMADRQVGALIKLAGRTKTRWALLTPDARVLQLAFADQVRADRPIEDRDVSDRELAMAADLLDEIGTDTPVLIDDDGVKLADYVAAKAAGGEVATIVAAVEEEAAEESLEAMLAAAVEAARTAKSKPKRTAKKKEDKAA